ncbi:MAG: hypothetical protein ACPL6D_12020 [Thermodesulfobacteriota bacterium]
MERWDGIIERKRGLELGWRTPIECGSMVVEIDPPLYHKILLGRGEGKCSFSPLHPYREGEKRGSFPNPLQGKG